MGFTLWVAAWGFNDGCPLEPAPDIECYSQELLWFWHPFLKPFSVCHRLYAPSLTIADYLWFADMDVNILQVCLVIFTTWHIWSEFANVAGEFVEVFEV